MSGMDRLTELLPCPFCGGTEADGSIERAHGTKYVMHNEGDDCSAFRGVLIPTQQWNRRALQAAPAPSEPVTLTYTNWQGKTAQRTITPVRVWFGSTPWHPEPQWLLTAVDAEKGLERDFALKDFGAPAPSDGLREAWIAGRDAAAAEAFYACGCKDSIEALTPPDALSASPAQEGGE